jgi:aryl-alcohol dehydrogenase-like predicted oxidoreductase
MADMTYRRLGRTGLAVSTVGLGCNNFGWRLDLEESRPVIDAAFEAGVTLFDTSDSYRDSEEVLGVVLEGRRDEVVLATKFAGEVHGANGPDWGARGSRRYIRRAVERSLRRLRTDWIDLYQLHRPDPLTPMEETLSALNELVREGKVRYLGCSNLGAWQVADAHWVARSRGMDGFISAQNLYSLMDRSVEADLVPACLQYGMGILPWFPLAGGMLTGRFHRGEPVPEGSRIKEWGMEAQLTDERFDVIEALEAFAAERSVGLVDVAIGALAAQPGVGSVIAGATSVAQVRANVQAGSWIPTAEDLAALDAIVPPGRRAGRPG